MSAWRQGGSSVLCSMPPRHTLLFDPSTDSCRVGLQCGRGLQSDRVSLWQDAEAVRKRQEAEQALVFATSDEGQGLHDDAEYDEADPEAFLAQQVSRCKEGRRQRLLIGRCSLGAMR